MEPWLQAVSEWVVADLLRRSTLAYLLANAAHIFSLGLLVGTVMTLDLRLLGAFGQQPLAVLGPTLSRMAALGLALAAATGLLLVTVRPQSYVQNPAFLAKLTLVAAGTANALWLRRCRGWGLAMAGGAVSPSMKLGAGVSLFCWIGAVLAGRWIGFLG